MGAILGVVLLDETVVGVALPTIQSELGLSTNTAHWVVNIYVLVFAALAAAAGRIGDLAGHGRMMAIGLAVFGLASIAWGLALGGSGLILARAAQGIGAAIIFPTSLAMVAMSFPEDQRGLALGIYGSIGTTFLALGPMTGGLITEYLSWRWIFFINPPIVLAIIVIVRAFWRDADRAGAAPPARAGFDLRGLALLVAGLGLSIAAVMEGPEHGWEHPAILFALALGLVLLVAFVRVEARTPDPLIEVDFFRNPTFAGCNLVIFNAQFGKMALFVFGALFLQDALGFSPLQAGLALLPAVAPQIAIAPIAGRVADRYGARWPSILAVLATAAGFALCAMAGRSASPAGSGENPSASCRNSAPKTKSAS